jgi:hypothetical protein
MEMFCISIEVGMYIFLSSEAGCELAAKQDGNKSQRTRANICQIWGYKELMAVEPRK